MKRRLFQVVRNFDRDMIGLVPIHGGDPVSIMDAIEEVGGKAWAGIPGEEDVRVAQVVLEIREHKTQQ